MKPFYFSQQWWQFILLAVVCYFIGCFNFARLISHHKHKDITKIGSGNPGTMNMSREFGLKVGLLTFVCDALKGGLPCLIGYLLYRDYVFAGTDVAVSDLTRYFCGLFVIVGHIFPVTTGFKGGKGIASTLGLFLFGLPCEWIGWLPIVFAFFIFLVLFIYLTEWGSLASLLGVTGLSVAQMAVLLVEYAGSAFNAYLVCLYMCIFAINLLTWCAHRENIARLFAGEEHHTSVKRLAKKK